ncbi:MAG: endonuclease [Frankiales bacterium]|nr:endonuclease [Frankiales bacterium]
MDEVATDAAAGSVAADLALLAAVTDRILGRDLVADSRDDVLSLTRGLQVQLGRLGFRKLTAYAELGDRGTPEELMLRGLPDLIAAEANCGRRVAGEDFTAINRFALRRALTGQRLAPEFPACSAALADGSISLAHAKVIADRIAELPVGVRAENGPQAEVALVEHARTLDPRALNLLAARVIAHLHPDGPEPDDDLPRRSRSFDFAPASADGTVAFKGRLAPETAAIWQTALAHLSGADAAFGDVPNAPGDLPDQRTSTQRRHDAFHDAGRRLLAAGGLPDHAGLPAALLITMTLSDLERGAGQATTHTGGTLTIPQALRLAADAELIPLVLADGPNGQPGEVLHEGRGQRLGTRPQRRALFVRDRGCSFPGCPRCAADSEVHHAPDWANGGRTDIDAMTITCGYHNREAPRMGWETVMIDGIPHWKPPAWLDPERTPRRNYVHHPELLLPGGDQPPDEPVEDEPTLDLADEPPP